MQVVYNDNVTFVSCHLGHLGSYDRFLARSLALSRSRALYLARSVARSLILALLLDLALAL